MSALLLPPTLGIKNKRPKEEQCYCDYHKGMVVSQVDAELGNGVHFTVVRDNYWRISIDGSPLQIANPEEIVDMLLEALK